MIGPSSPAEHRVGNSQAMRHSTVRSHIAIGALLGCCIAGNAVAASRGEGLAQQWCSQCHAVSPGQQSPNPKAPTFSAIAAEPSATDYSLRVFLRTTHATMPNFKIDPDDIDDLVAYIRSLKPTP